MREPREIAVLIRKLAEGNNISVNQALIESGAGSRLVANLDRGSFPSINTLGKIADYFNVSTDYLIGRNSFPTFNGQSNPIIQGNNNKTNTVYNKQNMSEELQELNRIYSVLTIVSRAKLITMASELEGKERKL